MTQMNELKRIASELKKKQELLKDYIAQLDAVKSIDEQIKELQEQRKAAIAADVEIASVKDEIKSLGKELKQAAKVVTKGLSFKPALAVAFAKASEEAVEGTKVKADAFKFLGGV